MLSTHFLPEIGGYEAERFGVELGHLITGEDVLRRESF